MNREVSLLTLEPFFSTRCISLEGFFRSRFCLSSIILGYSVILHNPHFDMHYSALLSHLCILILPLGSFVFGSNVFMIA
jgi:hypothetical protein